MLRTKEDFWTDKVFGAAYGNDVAYDGEKGIPIVRAGVGKLETGPTGPRAYIPSANAAPVAAPIQRIPTAYAISTVVPVEITPKTADQYAKTDVKAAQLAQLRLESYLSKVRSGQLK